ncbi:MAG: hypothetical protein ABIJ00_12170 [Candidatus Eisenbacteria bacterium]
MKTIVLVSVLILLAANIANGQCPGVYLYTDYGRSGCDNAFFVSMPVPI